MKIDITEIELTKVRDIIYAGRNKYLVLRKDVKFDYQYKYQRKMFDIGNELIKEINVALKQVHGHDFNGKEFLKRSRKIVFINKKNFFGE